MPCACLSVDVYVYYEGVAHLTLRAVHERPCHECGQPIQRGNLYEYYLGVLPGEERPENWVTCLDCLSVRDEFFCDGWIYGFLWEEVENYVYDVGGSLEYACLEALTPKARERIVSCCDDIFREDDED